MRILYAAKFTRQYKKLSPEVKIEVKEKLKVFQKDIFDPRLKTYKLTGKFSDFWSFSITYSYRIIFRFENKETIQLYKIGDHSIYQ